VRRRKAGKAGMKDSRTGERMMGGRRTDRPQRPNSKASGKKTTKHMDGWKENRKERQPAGFKEGKSVAGSA
jgi:hypothetical protein